VLIEFLESSDLTGYPEVADVLPHIFAAGPNGQGKESGYLLCREMISDAIRGRAHELTEQLGYSEAEAGSILVRAHRSLSGRAVFGQQPPAPWVALSDLRDATGRWSPQVALPAVQPFRKERSSRL
jgi:hypothetical protein